MNVIIASLNQRIVDYFEVELRRKFKVQNFKTTDNYEVFHEAVIDQNYDVYIVDSELKINGIGDSEICLKFFRKERQRITNIGKDFILISRDKKTFEHFPKESFQNICTFNYSVNNNVGNKKKVKDFVDTVMYKLNRSRQCLISPPTKVFFVHGFNGDGTTWDKFFELIQQDKDLSYFYELDKANYNTFKINWRGLYRRFFWKRYNYIEDLALQLKSKIEISSNEKFILVGHSLGCMIIKHFLLLNFQRDWNLKVDKSILFAPPNKGSFLATIVVPVRLRNPHVRFLSAFSIKRAKLNASWIENNIENKSNVKVLIAQNDGVVNINNAKYSFKESSIVYFQGKTHVEIKDPEDHDADIYKAFKKELFAL